MGKRPLIIKQQLNTNYTLTTSDANIGLKLIIPEDGLYNLTSAVMLGTDTAAVTSAEAYVKINRNDNPIENTIVRHLLQATAGRNFFRTVHSNTFLYLKKGDEIQYQARKGAGGENGTIYATTTSAYSTCMTAVKVG